jgi:hypothetical protein
MGYQLVRLERDGQRSVLFASLDLSRVWTFWRRLRQRGCGIPERTWLQHSDYPARAWRQRNSRA